MAETTQWVTWQPVLTDHQAYTYQALARRSGRAMVSYVTRLEDATRKGQGWTDTRVAGLGRRLIPAQGSLSFIVRQLRVHRHDIHLFGGAFGEWRTLLALFVAAWLGVRLFLVTEPYSPVSASYFGPHGGLPDRAKAWLRPRIYRIWITLLRRRLSGIFAISRLAMTQFAQAGMPAGKLFPFGYFVPMEESDDAVPTRVEPASPSPELRVAFVASLIPRKGASILLDAVRQARQRGAAVRLDLYGPGDPASLDLDPEFARYLGGIPFGETPQRLKAYDLMVLPSLYDGWGVVVNEALGVGVPVVCSDRVGAQVLVRTFGTGLVFPSGDAQMLADQLVMLAKDPDQLQTLRAHCALAAQAIRPDVAADYLWACIGHALAPDGPPPVSPWYGLPT